MSQDSQEIITKNLLAYANNLEQILLNYANYDVFIRKIYERKIQNLAQLSINKGIDIDDIAKEINQEKKNEKLIEKINNSNYDDKLGKNIKEIEVKNISSQIFNKEFYNNLSLYLKRKKELLKINNLFNNGNIKNNYGNSNTSNKYKNQTEQNISYDSKKNNTYIPTKSDKKNLKCLGKKRKNK